MLQVTPNDFLMIKDREVLDQSLQSNEKILEVSLEP